MALPKSYLTSVKRLPGILEAVQTAQAPTTFSARFLEKLGFKSKGDRLIIGVFKDLGMIDDKGAILFGTVIAFDGFVMYRRGY